MFCPVFLGVGEDLGFFSGGFSGWEKPTLPKKLNEFIFLRDTEKRKTKRRGKGKGFLSKNL